MGKEFTDRMPSAKRQETKRQRGKGLAFLKEKGIDTVNHCRKKDDLYQVKGIKRHLIMKGRR